MRIKIKKYWPEKLAVCVWQNQYLASVTMHTFPYVSLKGWPNTKQPPMPGYLHAAAVWQSWVWGLALPDVVRSQCNAPGFGNGARQVIQRTVLEVPCIVRGIKKAGSVPNSWRSRWSSWQEAAAIWYILIWKKLRGGTRHSRQIKSCPIFVRGIEKQWKEWRPCNNLN